MSTIPAGTYFIGDPCYCFSNDRHDDWMDYLNCLWNKEDEQHTYSGVVCFGGDTMHGDGVYVDQYGKEYCVDAGLIGATPISIAEDHKTDLNGLRRLGQIVTFKQSVEVETTRDGVIVIGHIEIPTDD